MVLLYVYDTSIVNTPQCPHYFSFDDDPVTQGLRKGIKVIQPPCPFLLRGIFGDYTRDYTEDYIRNKYVGWVIQPTFKGRDVGTLLSQVLEHGHDRIEKKYQSHPSEKELRQKRGIDYSDMIWAQAYTTPEKAEPYRFYDDHGDYPQGFINDFTLILDKCGYISADKDNFFFYQPQKELRRKALWGIIISDTHPQKKNKESLLFDLQQENREEIMKEIRKEGYFNHDEKN